MSPQFHILAATLLPRGTVNAVANHLWQTTLFIGLVWLLTLALRRNRAAVRHGLWLTASVKFLIPFSWLIGIGNQIEWRKAPALMPHELSFAVEEIGRPFALPEPAPPIAPVIRPPVSPLSLIPSALFGVWLCGFMVNSLAWWRRWRRVAVALRAATPLPLALPVRVLSGPTRLEPGVYGIRKPVVLLPEGIVGRLTPAQLQAILAHELCHVRRRDNLAAAIHMVVEALFWFHPLVWWLESRLMEERERACDEEVLRTANDPQDYAEGILNVCKFYVGSPLVCVSGVTGASLKRRIEAIMTNRGGQGLNSARKFLLASAGVAAFAGPVVIGVMIGVDNAAVIHAQSPAPRTNSVSKAVGTATPVQIAQLQPVPAKAKPAQAVSARSADPPLAFDVASVKVTDPRLNSRGFGYFTKYSPDTLTIRDISMWMCVRLAYGVENFRIAGPDSMLNPPFYDIVAKAASPVPESQLRLMLRKLLADRFHLTLHREKKEMSVTALLVAKGGSKLHPATGAFDPEHGDDAHMQNLGYDNNVHIQRSAGTNGNVRFTFTNASMALFAAWLESASSVHVYDKAPVVDLTGMQGQFDWVVDPPLVRPPSGGDGAGTPIVADGNTGGVLLDDYKPILERELGLTLGRRKAMVDILVIDHVDKEPTPN